MYLLSSTDQDKGMDTEKHNEDKIYSIKDDKLLDKDTDDNITLYERPEKKDEENFLWENDDHFSQWCSFILKCVNHVLKINKMILYVNFIFPQSTKPSKSHVNSHTHPLCSGIPVSK